MNKKNVSIALMILFGIAVFDMPYWYYQLTRLLGTLGLAYLCFKYYQDGIRYLPIILGLGVVFFNPIFKISFGRDLWKIIDFVYSIILLGTIIYEKVIYEKLKGSSKS